MSHPLLESLPPDTSPQVESFILRKWGAEYTRVMLEMGVIRDQALKYLAETQKPQPKPKLKEHRGTKSLRGIFS
jgi:hypothetical protein